MKSTSLLVFSSLLAGLALTPSASAQLELVIQADAVLTSDYDPAEDAFDPVLTIGATATPPATLNYAGAAAGAFTMRFVAPEGMRFVVNPQGGTLRLFFQVDYHADAPGGLTALETPRSLSFTNAAGTTPSAYTDHSAIHDIEGLDVAHLSVNFSMTVSEAFSFTELVYTRAFSGTGADVSLSPGATNFFLNVQDEHYLGAEPPLHTPYLSLVAIPEPSACALLGGLAVAALALGRRPRR